MAGVALAFGSVYECLRAFGGFVGHGCLEAVVRIVEVHTQNVDVQGKVRKTETRMADAGTDFAVDERFHFVVRAAERHGLCRGDHRREHKQAE